MSEHTIVGKKWGHEVIVVNTPLYCGKLLHVAAGKSCSWHYHKSKDETFWVASGKVYVRWVDPEDLARLGQDEARLLEAGIGVKADTLTQGDSFHVPPGRRHQFYGETDAVLVEFSTFHSEEDTVRVIQSE